MNLKEVIIDNLNILEAKLQLKHKIRTEISNHFWDNNLVINLTVFINSHSGCIVLEFTFKDNLFLEGTLYVSEAYNELDKFSEPINSNNNQIEKVIKFINKQEDRILDVISDLKFYIPSNISKLVKHNLDILNSVLKDNGVLCNFSESSHGLINAMKQTSYRMLYYFDQQPSNVINLII